MTSRLTLPASLVVAGLLSAFAVTAAAPAQASNLAQNVSPRHELNGTWRLAPKVYSHGCIERIRSGTMRIWRGRGSATIVIRHKNKCGYASRRPDRVHYRVRVGRVRGFEHRRYRICFINTSGRGTICRMHHRTIDSPNHMSSTVYSWSR